jgi:hypothetical protein
VGMDRSRWPVGVGKAIAAAGAGASQGGGVAKIDDGGCRRHHLRPGQERYLYAARFSDPRTSDALDYIRGGIHHHLSVCEPIL